MSFGSQLREWRRHRGVSQLELAARADVSQRHISFLETGRSRPSREMVIHLGTTLEVPHREQNLLLAAAGHAPVYSETPLEELGSIVSVLDHMLRAHEPNLAVVVDRKWDLIRTNDAATRFMARLFPSPPDWMIPPLNLMRLSFHPAGLRTHMLEWERTAAALLRRLEREVASQPHDPALRSIHTEVLSYPGVAELPTGEPPALAGDLLMRSTYLIDGRAISLFSTIATIGDAHDLTLQELRIETFWPIDGDSAEQVRLLVDP